MVLDQFLNSFIKKKEKSLFIFFHKNFCVAHLATNKWLECTFDYFEKKKNNKQTKKILPHPKKAKEKKIGVSQLQFNTF